MRFYTVHHRPGQDPAAADITMVPSGFSWMAAMIAPGWLLWHRLWLGLGLYLAVAIALSLLLDGIAIGDAADLVIGAALAFLIGASAAEFRRWTLMRRGLPLQAVVAAANSQDAELRYRLSAAAPAPRAAAASMPLPSAGTAAAGFTVFPRLV